MFNAGTKMPRRKLVMRNARFVFVVASAFALQLTACGGGDSTGGTLGGSSGQTGSGSSGASSSGASSSGASSSGATSSGGSSSSSGSATPDGGDTTQSPCNPLIGKWVATIDPGAAATGTDTQITGPLPIAGTINFTLTHDDEDLPDIVDFNGVATITAAGQTFNETIAPSSSPSGDTKDTKCNGGLNLNGLVTVAGVGDMLFTITGTLDTTATPSSGVGTFTWQTANDNGAALSAKGTLHLVKQP
jgi:hypothetical protein